MELHKWMTIGSINEHLFDHYKHRAQVVREMSEDLSMTKMRERLWMGFVFWLPSINLALYFLGHLTLSSAWLFWNFIVLFFLICFIVFVPKRTEGSEAHELAREHVLLLYNEIELQDFEVHSFKQIVERVHEDLLNAADAAMGDDESLHHIFDQKFEIYSRFDFTRDREYYLNPAEESV